MVLDSAELEILRRFVLDPSTRDRILKENDRVDEGTLLTEGTQAAKGAGSLSLYLIGRHETDYPALDDVDIVLLREYHARNVWSTRL